MSNYLRIFSHHSYKGEILNQSAFNCNEGSLSFYERRDSLDTIEGAHALRDSREKAKNLVLGVYELSAQEMRPFGLCPQSSPDSDDKEYGQYHFESECFETIFGIDDSHPKANVAKEIMNLRKNRLAQIAMGKIVVKLRDKQ